MTVEVVDYRKAIARMRAELSISRATSKPMSAKARRCKDRLKTLATIEKYVNAAVLEREKQ